MLYKKSSLERRKHRVRSRVRAFSYGRLRLSVFRSGRHIYAQVIDDSAQKTLVSASSIEQDGKSALKTGADCAAAQWVGKRIAEKALSVGISQVIFDRGEYRFHGRVKSLADAARSGGLSF